MRVWILLLPLLCAQVGVPAQQHPPRERTPVEEALEAISACHDRGAVAVAMAALEGRKSGLTRRVLASCMTGLTTPPAGSGNWPLHLEAALHLTGLTDGADLLPWLRGESGWYHNGRETGSPLYEGSNVAVALELHHSSPNPNVRAAARRWLRALWARMALTEAPAPTHMKVCIAGRCQERTRKERDWIYRGPWSFRPGERALRSPGAGGWGVHWDVDPLQPTFGAALNLPRRFRNKRQIPTEPGQVTLATLLPWVLHKQGMALAGSHPAALFGLTEQERSMLADFVRSPSATGARRIAAYLADYGDPREMVIARFANGSLLTYWQGWSRNGNKPAAVMVLRRPSGRAVYGVPSPWRGVGAAAARAEWIPAQGTVVGSSRASGVPTVVSVSGPDAPVLKPTLVLRLTAQGLRVESTP